MKSFIFLIALLLSAIAHSNVTAIYEIWQPESSTDNFLVLTTDGRVHEVKKDDFELVDQLTLAMNSKLAIRVQFLESDATSELLQQRKTIYKAQLYNKIYYPDANDLSNFEEFEEQNLTNFSSMNQATYYFNTMRTNTRNKSQCYNRALVWAYELWKNHGIVTTKNWMFFTRRYIREYRYHWWFHVTPITQVSGYGTVALDRKFMRSPTPIVPWKNFFMRNNAPCPLVTHYSSYRNNQEAAYCYWIRTNMYFWQPYHIENLERGYPPRYGWKQNELNIAYRDI